MKTPAPHIKTSLAGHVASAPADAAALLKLRRDAWQQQGVLIVRPDELADDWDRLHLNNIGVQLYGRRQPR